MAGLQKLDMNIYLVQRKNLINLKTETSVCGCLYEQENPEKIILVNGIFSCLFRELRGFAEKVTVFVAFSKAYSLDQLKHSRYLVNEAFNLVEKE